MRMNAFYILNELHNSDLVLEENFSPLKVFHNIADASRPVEKDAIEVASNVIKKINEIGIKNVPCHQDLYYANFVIYENKTILIDWEYSSMGDSYFDYADLFWQNEFDHNDEFKKSSLIEIGIESDEDIEKFEYFEMLSMITWGLWALRRSPNDNDGLMAIFFLVIGLELKREMINGQLSSVSKVMLPGIAAVGGMVAPALVYLFINYEEPLATSGWAIPTATDIAFSLAVLAVLGNRVPVSLKIFLLSLAIIDDLGAVLVIAISVSYTHLTLPTNREV